MSYDKELLLLFGVTRCGHFLELPPLLHAATTLPPTLAMLWSNVIGVRDFLNRGTISPSPLLGIRVTGFLRSPAGFLGVRFLRGLAGFVRVRFLRGPAGFLALLVTGNYGEIGMSS